MNEEDLERMQAILLNRILSSPEMAGKQIVAASILEELLTVLLKAGIVNIEQVNNILIQASNRLSHTCKKLGGHPRQDARLIASLERAREAGNMDIARIRMRVTEENDKHPKFGG